VTYPNIAPAGGAFPIPTNWAGGSNFLYADQNNTNAVANYAWGAADSAPVVARVATTGAETYTIVTGSVTAISGPPIDGLSVAVGDLLVIKDAPSATGPGSPNSLQPGNGIYYVTAIAANISVARAATMSPASSKPNPDHRVAFVGNGGNENGGSLFEVTTPSGAGAFIYGTTAIQWTQYPLLGAVTAPSVGASKLVSIGDNGWGSTTSGAATSTAGTSEMMFTVGPAATNITAKWDHFYTGTSLPDTDTDPSGSITFSASLKVLSSTNPGTVTGTLWRLTFNGRTSVTLDPGGTVVADVLGISVAPGDVVAIRTHLASGTAYAPRLVAGNSGWGGFTAASDLTAPGSAAITSSTGDYYGPAALLGYAVGANNAKSVLVLGDSIAEGTNDEAYFTVPALGSPGGFTIRALSGVAGIINIAIGGDLSSSFQSTAGSFRRLGNAKYCNSAIIEYGSNDYALGATAATIEGINLNIAINLRRLGIARVFLTTIIPRTTSTDGWATTTNQTPVAGESQRLAYNTWVRANCPVDPTTKAPVAVGTSGALLAGSFGHPLTGFFDTASKVESALNSGLWRPANRIVTGSITSGTQPITSSTANFQTANQEAGGDTGSFISLLGAGASGAVLFGNIFFVSSSTVAYVDANAGTTVTNAQLNIGILTAEGVHPTAHGHYLMSQAIDVALL
jgi:lysophospholipase L1-like esterase